MVVKIHYEEVVTVLKFNGISCVKMFHFFGEDLETVCWWKSMKSDQQARWTLLHLRRINLFHALSDSSLGGPKYKGLDHESDGGWSIIYLMAGFKGAEDSVNSLFQAQRPSNILYSSGRDSAFRNL